MECVSADTGGPTFSFVAYLSGYGKRIRLALAGELDADTVSCLTQRTADLAAVRPAPQAIRLDLTDLTFIDAAGARALTASCQRLQQHCAWFEVWGIKPQVQRVLDLLGMSIPACGCHDPPPGTLAALAAGSGFPDGQQARDAVDGDHRGGP